MRATVSIYEDPAPKSGADVWAEDDSKTRLYLVLVLVSLGIASATGYAAYHLSGVAKSSAGLGSLISKLPHYSPTVSDNLRLRRD